MKILAVLALATTLSQAYAATEYGGMKFHSTVERGQFEAMRADLKYLFQTPITAPDAEFMRVAQVSTNTGPGLHNWLLNRVRYIIGERYQLVESNIVFQPGKYPSTPLPDFPEEPEATPNKGSPNKSGDEPSSDVKTVMTNLGSALYMQGKQYNVYYGLKFDGEVVYAKSTRVGLLQVGEGLFDPGFLLNPDLVAPANSVSRLSTFFHEARHSDGSGKSTGFGHDLCPKGHPYFGYYACEASSNGSYTVGGLAQRNLLNNCSACSPKEKAMLTAGVADSFGRIVKKDNAKKIAQNKKTIEVYTQLIGTYKKILTASGDINRTNINLEIKRLEAEIVRLNAEVRTLETQQASSKPLPLESNPEGTWTPVSLQESTNMMEKSLRK